MISITAISCFFVASAFAAWPIPRTDLRLELMVNGSTSDTSGNNRITSYTGTVPSVITDSTYGIKNWNFGWNGSVRVNTSWYWGAMTDYTMSFWVKIPTTSLAQNWSNNLTTSTSTLSLLAANWYVYQVNNISYDKPSVIIGAKSWTWDIGWFRFAVSKEWNCSVNWYNSTSFIGYVTAPYYTQYWDSFVYQKSPFTCTIIDGKWHHLILTRKSGWLKIFIDWTLVSSWSNTDSIGKVITLGSMWFNPSISPWYVYYPTATLNDITTAHYYRWGLFAYRLYSAALSDNDLTNLYDEYRYIQWNINWTWAISLSIDSYLAPNLKVAIKNIPSNLTKNIVSYEYSVNSGSYTIITNLIDKSASGIINYLATLDLTNISDGSLNISFRTRTWAITQTIGSFEYTKIDNPTTITINNPDSTSTSEKFISAQASAWGILSFSLTRSSICDASLQFEDYSDLTFTTTADNGIRVCYRAIYPNLANKTVYKISTTIQGIQPREVLVTTPVVKLFDNYTIWAKSNYPKPNDSTAMMLDLLGVSASTTQWTINGVTMTDINGDGLVDFLYSRNDPVRRAIVVNNGDYTFKIAYKCAVDSVTSTIYPYTTTITYYGDCADFLR